MPSIQRLSVDQGTFESDLHQRELTILEEFKRRAHHYVIDPPALEQDLEWLTLLQHHGGATRLLDFTWSFYVAMYFAIRDSKNAPGSKKDAAIWAIDTAVLRRKVSTLVEQPTENRPLETIWKQHHKLAEEYLLGKAALRKLVVIVEPFKMNERLTIQQGFLLFPCDYAADFETNLATTLEIPPADLSGIANYEPVTFTARTHEQVGDFLPSGTALVKIIVSSSYFETAMSELRRMNVTDASLFPGLDGFARSLNLRLWPSELIPT
jgi:hypothetical protein